MQSDRSWSFAVSLALYAVGGDLLLPAVSNLANSVAVILFGVAVGKWVDGAPRLKAARWALLVNNLSVAASGLCLVLALWLKPDARAFWLLVIGGLALCALSSLAGAATKIVVAKDWVAVVAGGDAGALAHLNARMLLIDHVCGILSPLLAGQVMASADVAAGCLFVALWNAASFPVEYAMLAAVYKAIPALAAPKSVDEPLVHPVDCGEKEQEHPPLSQTDMSLLPPAMEAAAEDAFVR